jgi:hypothetical protein
MDWEYFWFYFNFIYLFIFLESASLALYTDGLCIYYGGSYSYIEKQSKFRENHPILKRTQQ